MAAGVSPTLARCIEVCLQYLGLDGKHRKLVTTESVDGVAGDGALATDDAMLRTSGDTTAIEAGDVMPVLWSRRSAAPGVRAAKPAVALRHHAQKAQPASPLLPRGFAVVEELLIVDDQWHFRNEEQLTPLGVEIASSFRIVTAVRWGMDDSMFGVVAGSVFDARIDLYQLNRRHGEAMGSRTATATFIRSQTGLTVPTFSDFVITRAGNVIFLSGNVGLSEEGQVAHPDTAGVDQLLRVSDPQTNTTLHIERPGGYGLPTGLALMEWDETDPAHQRFAYTWRGDLFETRPTFRTTTYKGEIVGMDGARISLGTLTSDLMTSSSTITNALTLGAPVAVSDELVLFENETMQGVVAAGTGITPGQMGSGILTLTHFSSGTSVENIVPRASQYFGGLSWYALALVPGRDRVFVVSEDEPDDTTEPGSSPVVGQLIGPHPPWPSTTERGRFIEPVAVAGAAMNPALSLIPGPAGSLAVETRASRLFATTGTVHRHAAVGLSAFFTVQRFHAVLVRSL